jgi:hypothetical protein
MAKRDSVEIGAWVAFLRGGSIHYGKVEYRTPRETWERSDTLVTTAGAVQEAEVLEVRRGEA